MVYCTEAWSTRTGAASDEKSNLATDGRWNSFYKFTAITALLIVVVGLVHTVTSMLGGQAHAINAVSVVDWFTLFQTHRLVALGNLRLFNILTLSLGIPLYLALFNMHRQAHTSFGALAVILFVMGTGMYISSNTVFPMLALSNQYAMAPQVQKPLLEAAGRALLPQGADLPPGTCMGFFYTNCRYDDGFSAVGEGIFSKVKVWLGIIGIGLRIVFFVMAAFVLAQFATAFMISAPGRLLLIAYHILLARRLFQLAR